MTVYLDANVFVYPVLHEGAKARAAAALLERVVEGRENAITAALSVEEAVWAYLRNLGRSLAVQKGRRILELPNLRVLDVRAQDLHTALGLMEKYPKLSPRDAVHAGVAVNAGVFTVVSDDSDFDDVNEITRRPLR